MTQAAVSYQIKLLEERVGGPLFMRGARGVTLSETGRRLAPAVTEAFRQLRAAFDDLNETADGILRITALGTFATNWLVPRLGAFQLAHPGDRGQARRLQRARRFRARRFRRRHSQRPRAVAGPRCAWPALPAAFTPMLIPLPARSASGRSTSRPTCCSLPLIDPTDDWWADWFAGGRRACSRSLQPHGIRVMNQQLAGRAALAGQGVAILMPAFFADELASGRLVQPFPIVRQIERDALLARLCRSRAAARRRSAPSAIGFWRRPQQQA